MGITGAILLGAGAGFGASKLIGGSSKSASKISSPLPLPQPPSQAAAADKAGEVIKKKKIAATQSIYTSPLGVAGQADVNRKTLLGQ